LKWKSSWKSDNWLRSINRSKEIYNVESGHTECNKFVGYHCQDLSLKDVQGNFFPLYPPCRWKTKKKFFACLSVAIKWGCFPEKLFLWHLSGSSLPERFSKSYQFQVLVIWTLPSLIWLWAHNQSENCHEKQIDWRLKYIASV